MQADKQISTTTSSQSDWLDGLLVKESSGRFRKWQSKSKASDSDANISQFDPSALKQSPVDDSFGSNMSSRSNDGKSELSFHDTDTQQLQAIGSQLSQDDSSKYSIDKIVKRIIEKHSLNLDQTNLIKFTDTLFDFFRGRKKAPLARQILTEKIASSGKSIDTGTVDSIMSVIKGLKLKIDTVGGVVVRAEDLLPNKGGTRAQTMDFLQEPRPSFVGTSFSENKNSDKTQEEIAKALKQIAQAPSKVVEGESSRPAIKIPPAIDKIKVVSQEKPIELKPAAPVAPVAPTKPPVPEVRHQPLPRVKRVSMPSHKVSVTDVVSRSAVSAVDKKFSLTGPVEELRNMTIGNFRYLGQSIEERMEKLLDKFSVLEQDSYTKRAQGIAAWRQSPVYKLYLDLGRESMAQNMQVEELVGKYKSENKPTLDMEEFNAITDLNKQLRF